MSPQEFMAILKTGNSPRSNRPALERSRVGLYAPHGTSRSYRRWDLNPHGCYPTGF